MWDSYFTNPEVTQIWLHEGLKKSQPGVSRSWEGQFQVLMRERYWLISRSLEKIPGIEPYTTETGTIAP